MLKKSVIITDDAINSLFLLEYLKSQEVESLVIKDTALAIARWDKEAFDFLFWDLDFLDISLLDLARRKQPGALFIFLSLDSKTPPSFDPVHVLQKPLRKEAIALALQTTQTKETELIAESPVMKTLLQEAEKIAKSNANVFLIGESGTGKEVLASLIHNLSFRAHKPFIRVNCAAIPDTLLESEFFGHEKGAFTGALQRRPGRFELADQGTLLLDEVSEIPLELQPKLLRALQEREFERVGGIKPVKVDVRLISTSNRNLQESLEKKELREDLFFRLHVIPLNIPPLRQRKEDIVPLAEHFLAKFCKDNHKDLKHLSLAAKECLLNYSFPGNVRELANLMERITVLHAEDLIEAEDLRLERTAPTPAASRSLADMEKAHILATLRAMNQNKTKTAESLGITLRTLRNKLKSYQLS